MGQECPKHFCVFYINEEKKKGREAHSGRDGGEQLRARFALQDFGSGKGGGRRHWKLCQSQISLPLLSNVDILKKNISQLLPQLMLAEELLIQGYQVENLHLPMCR